MIIMLMNVIAFVLPKYNSMCQDVDMTCPFVRTTSYTLHSHSPRPCRSHWLCVHPLCMRCHSQRGRGSHQSHPPSLPSGCDSSPPRGCVGWQHGWLHRPSCPTSHIEVVLINDCFSPLLKSHCVTSFIFKTYMSSESSCFICHVSFLFI